MRIYTNLNLALLLGLSFFLLQCSNDDDETPELINEEEEINRVTFDVTANNSTTTYTWEDGDASLSIPLKHREYVPLSLLCDWEQTKRYQKH